MPSRSSSDDDDADRVAGQRENEELATATNETSSIIVELSLEAPISIRWVSSSWQEIIGYESKHRLKSSPHISRSDPKDLLGQPIAGCLADEDKACFSRATEKLLQDDSQSVRTRFWLAIPNNKPVSESIGPPEALEIDANGILIHDRMVGVPTHVRSMLGCQCVAYVVRQCGYSQSCKILASGQSEISSLT